MTYLELISYLDDIQFGFNEGRSTVDALNFPITSIESSLQHFNYSAIISFDMERAFDTINWNTMSEIMDQWPLPVYLINILKNIYQINSVAYFMEISCSGSGHLKVVHRAHAFSHSFCF